MAEKRLSIPVSEVAKPVHIQRLEKSLDLGPFLSHIEQAFNNSKNDEDSNSTDDDYDESFNSCDDFPIATADDVSIDKTKLYNFSKIGHDRKWLQNVLQESSDSSEETSADEVTHDDYMSMLKYHALQLKYKQKYYANKDYTQYQYYSAGILSNYDKYPEHQKNVSSLKRKRREKDKRTEKKVKRPIIKKEIDDTQDESYLNYGNADWDDDISHFKDEFDDNFDTKNELSFSRKKNIQKNPEVMAARRKKVWVLMCKKEVGKVQRAKANNHKEMLVTCKKTAQLCMRHCRQKAMQSQKSMKEALWRAKRLTREMQAYWKRYDRVERENRRRLEKEAEEQRKMDVEMIEAKRQQRKLNFLITQTELYAHFMSRKLGKASPEEQLRILSQLDEERNPRLASIDDYD